MESLEITVARLDERTKAMMELLKDHCESPSCEACKLNDEVGMLRTNVSWIKRVGSFAVVVFATALGIKGF